MKKQQLSILLSVLTLLALIVPVVGAEPTNAQSASVGAVYILSNAPAPTGNHVMVYNRGVDGRLIFTEAVSTGGLGTGKGLGDQGALALSQDGSVLLAVNAGSNEISAFRVNNGGLTLTDTVGSDGTLPVSVTVFGAWVYALNGGSSTVAGNIAGFSLSDTGQLTPITGSVQAAGTVNAAPAQISFNPTGNVLAVTEKNTNLIDTYTVSSQGVASAPIVRASNGIEPFGFAFTNSGQLIVSEAQGTPTSNGSTLSSYAVSLSGDLTTISASIPDLQQAACWVAGTNNGRFAYTANTKSGSISSYAITGTGALSLLNSKAWSGLGGPLDLALSRNSRFLYVFNSGDHTIQGFGIDVNGNLTSLTTVMGIPAGASGLAAQ